ncbi:MAG: hypothetical protein U0V03_11895 [Bacteroidia bacterium]
MNRFFQTSSHNSSAIVITLLALQRLIILSKCSASYITIPAAPCIRGSKNKSQLLGGG